MSYRKAIEIRITIPTKDADNDVKFDEFIKFITYAVEKKVAKDKSFARNFNLISESDLKELIESLKEDCNNPPYYEDSFIED